MRELIVFSSDIVKKQSTFRTSNGKYFFSFSFNCLILTQCYSLYLYGKHLTFLAKNR